MKRPNIEDYSTENPLSSASTGHYNDLLNYSEAQDKYIDYITERLNLAEICIRDVVRSYLKENLKVKVELNFDFSKRSRSAFDVIVELDGEEISKTDFEVGFPCS